MVTNDDEIMIEDEDMTSVAYPKQRFQKPVRIGLFIYGDAPEDQDDQPVIRSGSGPPSKEDLVPDLSTEIWFENALLDFTATLGIHRRPRSSEFWLHLEDFLRRHSMPWKLSGVALASG